MGVQGIIPKQIALFPDLLKELFLGVDLLGMTEQELEDMIFFLAQTYAFLSTDRLKGSLEQTDIFKGLAFFFASQSLLAA